MPPQTPKILLSDNGSELEADVARLLIEHGTGRWDTSPTTPKMNARRRFNRTIRWSFVDDHKELLFPDLALFHRKLAGWLVASNAQCRRPSLDQQSPRSFLLQHQPQRQRDWTHTSP